MIQHLACVMDGNRRWATSRGLPTLFGHKQGVTAVRTVVTFCLQRSISYLSLYTFSLENFKRSFEEKSYLFNLIDEVLQQVAQDLVGQGVRIRFVGDRALFPESVRASCLAIEQATVHGDKLQLNILFCYGGRQEIVSSVKKIAEQVASGTLSPDAITQEHLQNNLWMPNIPDPDLIIRTGAVHRMSNFLLFQSAYSELIFFDCMWPDMTEALFEQALHEFNARERRCKDPEVNRYQLLMRTRHKRTLPIEPAKKPTKGIATEEPLKNAVCDPRIKLIL